MIDTPPIVIGSALVAVLIFGLLLWNFWKKSARAYKNNNPETNPDAGTRVEFGIRDHLLIFGGCILGGLGGIIICFLFLLLPMELFFETDSIPTRFFNYLGGAVLSFGVAGGTLGGKRMEKSLREKWLRKNSRF